MGYRKQLPDTLPQDPTTKNVGDWGERVAAEYLVTQGCAIREIQWRGQHFEIDIVAQKGDRIIFVEVKTRKSADIDPVDAVDNKKRQRMIRAADYYLKALGLMVDYQFDIIAIVGHEHDYELHHIPDAFFPTPKCKSFF